MSEAAKKKEDVPENWEVKVAPNGKTYYYNTIVYPLSNKS